jgi:hypothetical protein
MGSALAGTDLGGRGRRGLGYLLAQQTGGGRQASARCAAKLGARVRLLATGATTKNDPNDARSVAIAALRSAAPRMVAAEDHAAVLKVWSKLPVHPHHRRLFNIHAHPRLSPAHHEHWSRWRRRHQARARKCHHQQRLKLSNRALLQYKLASQAGLSLNAGSTVSGTARAEPANRTDHRHHHECEDDQSLAYVLIAAARSEIPEPQQRDWRRAQANCQSLQKSAAAIARVCLKAPCRRSRNSCGKAGLDASRDLPVYPVQERSHNSIAVLWPEFVMNLSSCANLLG